jgi:hypothetical protein
MWIKGNICTLLMEMGNYNSHYEKQYGGFLIKSQIELYMLHQSHTRYIAKRNESSMLKRHLPYHVYHSRIHNAKK